MNAVVEHIAELTVESALQAVRDRVAELRTIEGQHLEDEAALARGRERLASLDEELRKIEAENAAVVERHAKRLEQTTREGSSAPVPTLVVSDAHMARELNAQRTRAATLHMIGSLDSAVHLSAAKIASAKQAVDTALQELRTAEVHARIHDCLELLSQYEHTYSEIAARTEIRGDSKYGEQLYDGPRSWQDTTALMLRSVWNTLAHRRFGPNSVGGVLAEQPPLIAARARLAKRDQELVNPAPEQSNE